MSKLPPAKNYCVAFETRDPKTGKDHAGYVKAVQVSLDMVIMDSMDEVRVDLVDHPLYLALANYVKNNPPRK